MSVDRPVRVPQPPQCITLDCRAKLNLALAVGKPGAKNAETTGSVFKTGDGLHPIASWMVALDFADRLTVKRLAPDDADAEDASVFDLAFVPLGSGVAGDRVSPAIDWPLERDLTFRAHGLVERHVGRPLPIHMTLEKRIPTGAGLGGGSSDAAGMIIALDRLFSLGMSNPTKRDLADQLGSDVHFALAALTGTPSAIVTGSGDQLESASFDTPLSIVLILPPFGCSTGPVYGAFDRMGLGRGQIDINVLRGLLAQDPLSPDAFFNDLAPAACEVEPRLASLLHTLRHDLGLTAHVTGSGAACFVVADSAAAAERIANVVQQRAGCRAIATTTRAGQSPSA